MEESLGKILDDLKSSGIEVRSRISPSDSNIANLVRGFPGDSDVDLDSIATWSAPADGPESAILRLATAQTDRSCLPLLSVPMWEFVIKNQVCPDDFSFVVATHYCEALRAKLGQETAREASREELNKALMNYLGKGNALMSSALFLDWLATGVAATGPIAIAAGLGFLLLLAFQVREITDTLDRLDTQLQQAYIKADGFTYEQLRRIAGLGAYRERLISGISSTLAMELGLAVLGAKWPLAARVLRVRAFYFDLKMLIPGTVD
jgi:hypothetical protein